MSSSLTALLAGSTLYAVKLTKDNVVDQSAIPANVTTTSKANVTSSPLVKPGKVTGEQAAPVILAGQRADEEVAKGPAGLPGMLLPGTYDARRFMAVFRHAKDLTEKKVALSGYKGYDNRRDFASQEQEALFHVRRETVGVAAGLDRTTERSAKQTARGYVAGMPKPQERLVLDLQARERDVIAMMSEHQKVAQDMNLTPAQRHEARVAMGEGDKFLTALREELATLGFDESSVAPEHASIQSVSHEDDENYQVNVCK